MRVDNFNRCIEDNRVRVSATVSWEDCDRGEREIYIDTDVRFADGLACNPNAFLLLAIISAMRHEERRIVVDGKVCPRLRDGLGTAMQQLRHWYGEKHHKPVHIEATQGFQPPCPQTPARTASFMSGGVDSLTTLRGNRSNFPLDHPGSIRDCFFVHGFDVGGYENLPSNRENSERAVTSLSALAKTANVTLIPVYTNMRHLDDSDQLFALESHGACLAAIAHAFSRRVTHILVPSTYDVSTLFPWGSHPLLDPHYSTADLCVEHDGIGLTRLEKVGLICEWDEALKTLRSCFDAFRPPDALNCGECEKCLRTMTELLVYGKLNRCPTYTSDDVSPELLRKLIAVPPAALSRQPEMILKDEVLRKSANLCLAVGAQTTGKS